MNEVDETKVNYRGFNDIKEYNIDELPSEYDSEDENIPKPNFQTFNLPKKFEDYKWKFGTYFASRGYEDIHYTFWYEFEV